MRGCNSLKEVGAFLILSNSIQERNNHQHHHGKLIISFCIFFFICLCRFVITAAHCLYDVVEGNPSKQVSWGELKLNWDIFVLIALASNL